MRYIVVFCKCKVIECTHINTLRFHLKVSQRPKDGGAETRLGSWNNWVDNKYEVMFYSGGQSCWNGPQRQAHVRLFIFIHLKKKNILKFLFAHYFQVKLICNTNTEVVGASEPSRCEYLLEFHTPAACSVKDIKDTVIDQHDEL